jgi:hypothetical protein
MTICRASLTRVFGDEEPKSRLGDFVQNAQIQNVDDEDVSHLFHDLEHNADI